MKIISSLVNGVQFLKFSGQFLWHNKDLMLLPIISFLASILFVILCVSSGEFIDRLLVQLGINNMLIWVLLLIFAYFCLSFIILYFTTSLYACTLMRLSGEQGSLSTGMTLAASKWKQILGWSIISTTVGFILQLLESINNAVADIVSFLFGLSWSIASYFVLPVLITEDIGPISALKKGSVIFGKGWRKTISVNFVLFLIIFALIGLISLITHLAADIQINKVFEEVTIGILASLFVLAIIIVRVFNTIIASGLYLSLVKKVSVPGLNQQLTESAFKNKKNLT